MANKNSKNNKAIVDLYKEVDTLKSSIEKLNTDIDLIKNGDGTTTYWNGENAIDTIKSMLKYIDVNNSLIDIISNCKDLQN